MCTSSSSDACITRSGMQILLGTSQKWGSVWTVGANTNSIAWRHDHKADCGRANRFCLLSPSSTGGLERFVLTVAVLCTIWELLWSRTWPAFVLHPAFSSRPHRVNSLPPHPTNAPSKRKLDQSFISSPCLRVTHARINSSQFFRNIKICSLLSGQ